MRGGQVKEKGEKKIYDLGGRAKRGREEGESLGSRH